MDEVCVELTHEQFLPFCTQLTKLGCDVIAVNTFGEKPYVWITNSPFLQTQLIPVPEGMTCSGFLVKIMPNKPKGKLFKKLRNASYFDLVRFCDLNRPTSWSCPACLDVVKRVYR